MALDPATIEATGSLLSGIGSLGGLFGGKKKGGATYADMLSAERHRIRHTVEDAQKAGIHPLYALGAAGAPSTPNVVGDYTGSGLGEGLKRTGEAVSEYGRSLSQKDLVDRQEARLEKTATAQAKADEAQAEYWLAQASALKRAEQRANSQQDVDEVKVNEPGARKHKILGKDMWVPHDMAPMEDLTQELGEPADWVLSPFQMMRVKKFTEYMKKYPKKSYREVYDLFMKREREYREPKDDDRLAP